MQPLILSIGLALITARRNERRIGAMDRVLEAVGTGALDRRIGDPGNDDLAELAASVDKMLDRLEAGVESIRQVSTDVAHDPRAPLARLRMRLEPQVLSASVPEETRHGIGSALMDIDAILRLARLPGFLVQQPLHLVVNYVDSSAWILTRMAAKRRTGYRALGYMME